MSRTDALCAGLGWSGALALKAAALRVGRSPWLRVLAYHRVLADVPEAFPFDPEVVSCTADEFEREMAFVRRHFDVLGFDDLAGGGLAGARRPLIVTFDDGYRDNHEVVLPILRRLGMKAVFFVTTGYMDGGRVPWWEEIVFLVKHRTRGGLLRLDPVLDEPVPVDGDEGRRKAVARLLRTAKALANGQRAALLSALRRECGNVPADIAGGLMMNWDHVRALSAAGMEVGSHTVSHPVLGTVEDAGAIDRELADSKRRIEQETGRAVVALSYPVGKRSGIGEDLVARVRAAGYRFACAYEPGVNPREEFDAFRLLRIKTEVGRDFRRFRGKVLFPRWIRH